ncbi:hypothetical protein [Burkholderia sp. Ac-20379]|uniref:hypothetical protein n=1 Tax=Burkholderia sp. Ac-20379 TaxID=2703900 RepID=UPI00197E9F71|nr:hypothetical protein [Burkholderia sp. Ac-20379]MBN3723568.1 hypothetical protein [Burkholderia sp. Ac-20379]
MKFQFTAENVVSYVEDDVVVVSFADSMSDEPQRYLILSQALFDSGDDDGQISVEYGADGDSVNTDVLSARLNSEGFELKLDPAAAGVSEFQIDLVAPLTDEHRAHLAQVFHKSKGNFSIE